MKLTTTPGNYLTTHHPTFVTRTGRDVDESLSQSSQMMILSRRILDLDSLSFIGTYMKYMRCVSIVLVIV
jgi:hypothetical protein